jgi:hypothetical protein
MDLPACLFDSGDFTVQRQFPETQTTEVKLFQIGPGPSALATPMMLSNFEFWNPLGFDDQRFSCHSTTPLFLFGF